MSGEEMESGGDGAHQSSEAFAEEARAFRESLEQRQRASEALQKDLLNEVPMLYGSPYRSPTGLPVIRDPGIELARIHRKELLRRNGVKGSDSSKDRSAVALPFEGLVLALALLIFIADLLWG